jgi:phospholipase C
MLSHSQNQCRSAIRFFNNRGTRKLEDDCTAGTLPTAAARVPNIKQSDECNWMYYFVQSWPVAYILVVMVNRMKFYVPKFSNR